MYDVYLYLYVDPAILKQRMSLSQKNSHYLRFDIEKWQTREINGLRAYCHKHHKDFYVVDNPPENSFCNVQEILDFIRDILSGYSCVSFAKKCAEKILDNDSNRDITLLDGDKTLTIEDSSKCVFGYSTNLYDGNFYTGYQAWKQEKEFLDYHVPKLFDIPVHINNAVLSLIKSPAYILTSGHESVWQFLSQQVGIPYFGGNQMCAETKLYITEFLQAAGKKVTAIGDGMNDYFMLKYADRGYLVRKQDGSISRSLLGKNLEGITLV